MKKLFPLLALAACLICSCGTSTETDTYIRVTLYNESGDVTEVLYFNKDSVLHNNECGWAREESTYDADGKLSCTAFYSADGKLANDTEEGWARKVYTYDENSQLFASWALYNAKGKPVNHKQEGWARWESTYDDHGNQTCHAYYDAKGKLVNHKQEGWARGVHTYDTHNNETCAAFYDADGKLVNDKDFGWARWEKTFDDNGNLTSSAYYSADGKPANNLYMGWARIEYTYDADGNQTSFAQYDADGNLTDSTLIDDELSSALTDDEVFDWDYDDLQNALYPGDWPIRFVKKVEKRADSSDASSITTCYYDADGRLAECPYGWARSIQRNDSTEYYDAEGNRLPDLNENL